MNQDVKVLVTSEPGVKGQFGKGAFSYQGAKKVSPKVAIGSCITLAATILIVVMSGAPIKEKSDRTSHFLQVEIPVAQSSIERLQIPKADPPGMRPVSNLRGRKEVIRFSGPELVSRPRNIKIPPGSMVEAVLIAGASNGPTKAELKESLKIQGETLLESGTVLVGTGRSGEERLMIHFTKAVFRDGTIANVNAQAADIQDKIAGLKGNLIGYRAVKLAAGIGLNFIGGLSQGLQETQGQQGATVTPPTMRNALLNGAARASAQESQHIMEEYRNERPVFEVSAGTPILALFEDETSN